MDDATDLLALDLLLEISLLVTADMRVSLARDGLTPSRTRLLWEVGMRGPMTQRALADALGVSPRNVTGLVDALVTTGFVTREPHPTDRRAAVVSFTEHGAVTVTRLQEGRRELAHLLFGDLPDGRLAGLAAGLGDVRDRLLAAMSAQEA